MALIGAGAPISLQPAKSLALPPPPLSNILNLGHPNIQNLPTHMPLDVPSLKTFVLRSSFTIENISLYKRH